MSLDKTISIYAELLDGATLAQFESAMAQDFAIKGALMPDAHKGYSLPIGGVVAVEGNILPSWVGYDIGCGMCALPTSCSKESLEAAKEKIFQTVYQRIPVGNKVNRQPTDTTIEGKLTSEAENIFSARGGWSAVGSLGSGNHFIEFGTDENDQIWIVIHSGSRGVGHGIAGYYMALAAGSDRPTEGHYPLRTDSDAGQAYINDMNWCLQFALENRLEMMRRLERILTDLCGEGTGDWGQLINRNHNHADFNHGYWIHRKGATHAEEGMEGVIPGNMRDGSFVVCGKGNSDALWSSSHGAGRVLGRNQAKRTLSMKNFREEMQGVTAKVSEHTLDEAPMAYKNIFEVMRMQQDLVDVTHHIRPLINIKA
jgi:tRNA-splicing ligase RtcB